MKKLMHSLLLLSCIVYANVNAQTAPPKKLSGAQFDQIINKLTSYRDTTNKIYAKQPNFLISSYSYRSLIQKDYSKITVGENSFTKVGRFATLKIDEDESKFYFTPFVFVVHKDPLKGSFKYIHSIDFSGEMSDKVFDFKSKKTLKAGYSFTKIIDGYLPKTNAKNINFHEAIVNEAFSKTKEKYERAKEKFSDYLEIVDEVEKVDQSKVHIGAKKKFFKTLEELELKYYEEKWHRKKIAWLKFNATPISWDNFKYIDPSVVTSLSTPIDKSVYTANLKASYNELYTYPNIKNLQVYLSIFTGLSRKHSLSEISKPSQWYNMKKLTDSTSTISEDEKVFSMSNKDFKTKFRPDFGAQIIVLFDIFNETNIGVDFATSFNGLVTSLSSSYVNKTSIGLLIPFRDKEGDNSINFELFYERKSYLNAPLTNDGFWGIKFGLPFNKF